MAAFMIRTISLLVIWGLIFVYSPSFPFQTIMFVFLLTMFWLSYFSLSLVINKSFLYLAMAVIYGTMHVTYFSDSHFVQWLIYPLFILLSITDQRDAYQKSIPLVVFLISLTPFALTYSVLGMPFIIYSTFWLSFLATSYSFLHSSDQLTEKTTLLDEALKELRFVKRKLYSQDKEIRNEERTKIARDMHDSVGHQLTALMMQLEMAERSEEPTDSAIIKQAKELARHALQETRHAVRQLKTDDQPKGMNAVLQLLRKLESESHLQIHLTTREGILSAQLTNEQNVAIYRFIQEGMTNVMRHGQTREVFITLALVAQRIVTVKMENRIYDNKNTIEEGFGLLSMKERFASINGKIDVTKTRDSFLIEGTFPILYEEDSQ